MSLCHFVSKKNSVITRHYVTLSLKKICHYLSLCYSVSKKHSVIICLYVILSLKKTLSLLVTMLFCL